MGDYRTLKVWERAHQRTLDDYRVMASFPREELFGSTSQTRRAAASIPANIAEGCGRNGDAELACLLDIANGSANELDDHLLLAHDLNGLADDDHERLGAKAKGVARMLATFIQTLRPTRRPNADSQRPIADSR